MEIVDMDGRSITVTNLDEALKQVKQYLQPGFGSSLHNDKQFVEKRNRYWTDIHIKLLRLKDEDKHIKISNHGNK